MPIEKCHRNSVLTPLCHIMAAWQLDVYVCVKYDLWMLPVNQQSVLISGHMYISCHTIKHVLKMKQAIGIYLPPYLYF